MDILKILLLHGMIVLLLAPVLYHGTFAVFKKGAIYLSTKSLKTENPDAKLFNQVSRVVKRESVEQGSGIGAEEQEEFGARIFLAQFGQRVGHADPGTQRDRGNRAEK